MGRDGIWQKRHPRGSVLLILLVRKKGCVDVRFWPLVGRHVSAVRLMWPVTTTVMIHCHI